MNSASFLCLVIIMLIAGDVSAQGRWSVGLEPSVGSSGWKIQGKITFSWGGRKKRRQRRDTEGYGKFNIVLQLNPCLFKSYDRNENDDISLDEIQDIFGNVMWAEAFFLNADHDRDNKITESEFNDFRSNIQGCY